MSFTTCRSNLVGDDSPHLRVAGFGTLHPAGTLATKAICGYEIQTGTDIAVLDTTQALNTEGLCNRCLNRVRQTL